MLGQLSHKALAETHDLVVRLALRVEVRTALAAAHRQCGQAVLEDLLKAQELNNRCAYRRVQTQTTLVRSDCRVELAAETTVYLNLAVVVYPGNTELDHALRFYDAVDYAVCLIRRVLFYDRLQRHQNFADCLQEFRLVAVALYDAVVYALKISVLKCKCHGNLLLLDKNVGLKCSKTFCQGYGTFCQKTRIRTLSKLKMYVMYVHSLQTPVHALRTTSIIHHSAMFFNAKLTNFCIFLISKSQKPKKRKISEFQISIANSESV